MKEKSIQTVGTDALSNDSLDEVLELFEPSCDMEEESGREDSHEREKDLYREVIESIKLDANKRCRGCWAEKDLKGKLEISCVATFDAVPGELFLDLSQLFDSFLDAMTLYQRILINRISDEYYYYQVEMFHDGHSVYMSLRRELDGKKVGECRIRVCKSKESL